MFHFGRTLGIVAEFGGNKISGLPTGTSAHLLTYMFGPRLTYRASEKVEPFLHALFGGAHVSGSVSGTVSPASNSVEAKTHSPWLLVVEWIIEYRPKSPFASFRPTI